MGMFRLCGFRIYLNLFPAQNRLKAIEDSDVFYRVAHFNQPVGAKLSHKLSIA